MLEIAAISALICAQIALTLALFTFIARYMKILLAKGLEVPYVPTSPVYYPRIAEALAIAQNDIVYDLGCGNGRFLVYCALAYPHAKFVGIERSRVLITEARIRRFLKGSPKNLIFRRENFYTTDFSEANRIYAYLLPKIMDELFMTRSAPGLRLVSRAFTISNKDPVEKVQLSQKPGWYGEHLLYVYEF